MPNDATAGHAYHNQIMDNAIAGNHYGVCRLSRQPHDDLTFVRLLIRRAR